MLTLTSLFIASSTTAFISFPGGPRSICGLGDVDKDGCADIAVGVGRAERGGFDAGAVYVVSGKNGKPLAERVGSAACSTFGTCLTSFRDFDGDGVRDFVVAAPKHGHEPCLELLPGSVFIVSGKDASILASWKGAMAGDRFGYSLANGGDVDGDEIDDLIVGAPGSCDAYVLSGKDGRRIVSVHEDDNRALFGESVLGVGDLDGDGHADFAVGSPGAKAGGRVVIVSGKTGTPLFTLQAPDLVDSWHPARFGCSLGLVPDLEGKGKSGLLVGADQASHSGRACVFSLTDQKRLRVLEGTEWVFSRFGSSLDGIDDVNGDGVGDFVISDPDDGLGDDMPNGQAPGSVFVISGKSGEKLCKVTGDKHLDRLGYAVAACGDLNADGVPDFVAEAHVWWGEAPYFRAYSGRDGKLLFQFDPRVPKPPEPDPPKKR